MNCPNCGSDLPEDATFCTNCGANIGGEESAPEPKKTAKPEPPPPAAEPKSAPKQKAGQAVEPKPFFKQWYGITLIIVIVLILLCCCCSCIATVIGGSYGSF